MVNTSSPLQPFQRHANKTVPLLLFPLCNKYMTSFSYYLLHSVNGVFSQNFVQWLQQDHKWSFNTWIYKWHSLCIHYSNLHIILWQLFFNIFLLFHLRFHSSRDNVALSWLSSYGVGSGKSSGSLKLSKYGCSRASSAVGLSSPSRTSIFSNRSIPANSEQYRKIQQCDQTLKSIKLYNTRLSMYKTFLLR